MKKQDWKKMALMGLASGLVFSGDVSASSLLSTQSNGVQMARGGCGSKCGSAVADASCGGARPQPRQDADGYGEPTADASCGGARPQQGYSEQYNSGRGSCGGARPQQRYSEPSAHSCGGQNARDRRYGGPLADNSDSAQYSQYGSQSTSTQTQTMSEDDLKMHLNDEGKSTYEKLTPEGKLLALRLANGSCQGKNSCKGQGGCSNKDHDCAGKNSCRGQGTALFTDKNKAVQIAKKMSDKRSSAMNSTY